jgi:hypothetical protein
MNQLAYVTGQAVPFSENELDGQACPADHWFSGQDLGIDDDAFRKRHNHSLVCNGAV